MEIKLQIPFQQLLTAVKTLTPTQKSKLRQEHNDDHSGQEDKAAHIDMLLEGPGYTEKEIQTIKENKKKYSEMADKLMVDSTIPSLLWSSSSKFKIS